MRKPEKGQKWVFNKDIQGEQASEGVERKVLAYGDEMMCVENHFQTGAVGALHHHPHTQITYVASGKFEFTIGEETKVVEAGDTLLKQNDIVHGCVCLEKGILVDIFTPMREDFL
jgi:quercetin dioxygenase-like cupin family protein